MAAQEFSNEYTYDKKTAYETKWTYTWHTKKGKVTMVLLPAMAVFSGILLFKARTLFWAAVLLMCFVVLGVRLNTVRLAVEKEMENLKKTFRSEFITTKYVINESGLRYFQNGKNAGKPVGLKNVDSWCETKRFFVIFLRGTFFVPFKKDSFTKGSEEEFRQYLSSNFRRDTLIVPALTAAILCVACAFLLR